jgi:hypothetical protein
MKNCVTKFRIGVIILALVCVYTYGYGQKELTSNSYKIRQFKKIYLDKYVFFVSSTTWEDSTGTVMVNTNDKTISFYTKIAKTFHYAKIEDTYKVLDLGILPFNWNVLFPCFDEKNIKCRIRFQESMNSEVLNATYLFIDYNNIVYQYNLEKY